MKTHSFIYTEAKRTYSRTYGGSTYVLRVYDITGGKLVGLGEVEACTHGHKGEDSEAWGLVLKVRPELRKLLAKRAKAAENHYALSKIQRGEYYTHQFAELGVSLRSA